MPDRPEPKSAPGLTPAHADGRLVAPAAERNTQALLDALAPILAGRNGLALEIGSGTGQHAAAFARAFPNLTWQPSDPYDSHLDSIRAWLAHSGATNVLPPIRLEADLPWPKALAALDAVFSANVIHITPWAVAQGIVAGAAQGLSPGGLLMFYGPFKEGGQHTGEGNANFDATLRSRDPSWGIRDIDDVTGMAQTAGLIRDDIVTMPANNRLAIFSKT